MEPFGIDEDAAEDARGGDASSRPRGRCPPVAMTKVMPIAITPTTLAWVSMLRTLSQVGNVSGLRIAPATNSATTTIAERVLLELERAPTRRAQWRRRVIGPPRPGRRTSVGATAWRSSSRSLGVGAGDLGDQLALAHDEDAAADADELLELGGDDQHAEAGCGEGAERAGRARPWSATSTPRVGSSSSSTRHSCSSQRASTTFCWLPPESSRAMRSASSGTVFSARSCVARPPRARRARRAARG